MSLSVSDSGVIFGRMTPRNVDEETRQNDDRILLVLSILISRAIVALMIGIIVFGMWNYPHAPIRPCGVDLFCDKRGVAY